MSRATMRGRGLSLGARMVLALCAALLVVLATARVAVAQPGVGSITLLLGDGSGDATNDMVGGSISLYRVALVDRSEPNYERFDISAGQFESSEVAASIPDMSKKTLDEQNAELASELEEEAQADGIRPVATASIRDGQVAFFGVNEGLYLLRQKDESEGGRKMPTFLLTVPGEDGELNIVAQPKPEAMTPSTDDPTDDPPGKEDPPSKDDPSSDTPPSQNPPADTQAPNDPADNPSPGVEAGDEEQAGAQSQMTPPILLRAPQTGDASLPFVLVAMGGLAAVGLGILARARSRRDG